MALSKNKHSSSSPSRGAASAGSRTKQSGKKLKGVGNPTGGTRDGKSTAPALSGRNSHSREWQINRVWQGLVLGPAPHLRVVPPCCSCSCSCPGSSSPGPGEAQSQPREPSPEPSTPSRAWGALHPNTAPRGPHPWPLPPRAAPGSPRAQSHRPAGETPGSLFPPAFCSDSS